MSNDELGRVTDSVYPPRFWWLKRLSLVSLILLLLLAGFWGWWRQETSRRLKVELDALRARGEPILPADLQPPPVRDEDNAAYYLKLAADRMDKIHVSPLSNVDFEWRDELPYPPKWHAMAEAAVKANAETFRLVREARRHARVDWGIKYSSPLFKVTLPHLRPQRILACLLSDAAQYHHACGNDAAALECIRDILFLAEATEQQSTLIGHLVAVGVRAMAVHRVKVLASELAADRERIRELIDLLLDERDLLQNTHQAMQGERVIVVDSISWFTQGSLLLRPMYDMETLRGIRYIEKCFPVITQPNWPAAKAAIPTQIKSKTISLSGLFARYDAFFLHNFRIMMECRMAAVALAVRMYGLDHKAYPHTLQDLVPRYLPCVPADPFAADGRPLGYLLAVGGKRPIVYSVGENGIDETTKESVVPTRAMYGWQNWGKGEPDDQWRDLSAWKDPHPPEDVNSDSPPSTTPSR